MFLTKADIAALMLHSFSAGVTSLLLVYASVVGDGSPLARLLSIYLFLVNSGAVLRVLWSRDLLWPVDFTDLRVARL